ncbi:phosphorylase family protein [Sphaerisporangium fuscum]|uniref:phosphorylase family protein n=1 Tax=Sphaerisporangium fuscum TaxID=2835868 RepID=UPI001BDC624C|nr:hypothetical protein [Sphaerisporangium fuscum]
MIPLLICTGLGIESRAVRRGLPACSAGVQVMRTGFGPRRAARTAAALPPSRALAVVGFGGALNGSLRPGDVLVASEIRYGDLAYSCPSAAALAGLLSRAGLPARTGVLLTSGHVVTGAERGRLAREGADAVDMETGPLAAVASGRLLAAVRVIVDTPAAPLPTPATVRGVRLAGRALRRLGPGLIRWAASGLVPEEVGR